MKIIDEIRGWYIRNIILPKIEEIDKPGFISENFTHKKMYIHLREIFLPENLFSNLERKSLDYIDYILFYKIGKKFAFINSFISYFPTITKINIKSFLKFSSIFIKYVEGTWASKIEKKNIDIDKKFLKLKMDNFIVCSKNGLGYIFSEGGIAGIWAYACQDPSIEAVQPKCQGRGDKECEVIAAPYETLVKMGYKPMRCTELETMELDKSYLEINKVRPTKYAKNSLKDLIDFGFFKYAHGQVTYKDERFFLVEASFMYYLKKKIIFIFLN